jgi:hypothetical protein
MHKQYPINEEDIEFPKVSYAKQMPQNSLEAKHREIGITATISPGIEPGQRVLYCVLQSLCYNIADMHKLTPNIQEIMAFLKWLSVNQNLRKVLSGILPLLQNLCKFAYL